MPLICLASSGGASEDRGQGGTVAGPRGRGARERQRRERGWAKGGCRERRATEEDGKSFSGEGDSPSRRASRWRRSICCSFFSPPAASFPLFPPWLHPSRVSSPLPLLSVSLFHYAKLSGPRESSLSSCSFFRRFFISRLISCFFPLSFSFYFTLPFSMFFFFCFLPETFVNLEIFPPF